ncbi:MAG: DUF4857 domain-containing protein [Desulfovibrio sp.]|nr:MAG: DUF4857 domain-containing protein [Desulfovibrio sp.]
MLLLARYALMLTAVLVLAVYVPMLFDASFGERDKKTHMFYSPVLKKFIWRELVVGTPPEGEIEDVHHAQYVQMDQDGNRYTRRDFETMLPFIYYKNMDVWGLLPLELEGQVFDKEVMRDERQVMELKPRQIAGRSPGDGVHPLIESVPDRAGLVFPEERFRLDQAMSFINADFNVLDREKSIAYTQALSEEGFVFPGRLVAGKPTILKPFDEGVFLVDHAGAVFHVKQVEGEPWVVRTPIDPAIGVRHIKISENSRRDFYGLLLTNDDKIFVISYDNYELIPLPVDNYDPDRMDFKLIVNPLYRTAVYSDDTVIRAVAMDSEYTPIDSYEHVMAGATPTLAEQVFSYIVPFRVDMSDPNTGYAVLRVTTFGVNSLIAIGMALAAFVAVALRTRAKGRMLALDGVLVAFSGIYGLLAMILAPRENVCP